MFSKLKTKLVEKRKIRMARTIREVARMAGVSPTTVSQVLNNKGRFREETRRLVLETAARLGYTVERTPSRTLKRLAVIFPVHLQSGIASNELYQEIYETITRRLPQGVNLLAVPNDLNFLPLNSALTQQQIDAAILFGVGADDPIVERLKCHDIPTLLIMRQTTAKALHWVSIDHRQAAYDATRHLLSKGHQDIVFLITHDTTGYVEQRIAGFTEALAEAGVNVDERRVLIHDEGDQPSTIDTVFRRDSLPTAIFASPDTLAVKCIHEAKRLGLRVPEDLSVIGFDDLACASQCDPPLTTIGFSRQALGELSVALLQTALERELVSITAIVPHRIVERASTGPPRRN